jgi:hypothetical protein
MQEKNHAHCKTVVLEKQKYVQCKFESGRCITHVSWIQQLKNLHKNPPEKYHSYAGKINILISQKYNLAETVMWGPNGLTNSR